ncbi:YihY/virulence factor BrkB family protein [Vagococcus silagei]|uniref:YihY/virulence factor BrkB family protein n=1 Tax=Vagococcus silagei TaxID=2508885 RepID=A0A4S3B363_9ENTE|nr:YihY/virulence factor BrkB family protein [Vagococcus silagei]THB60180.1 YihY/virulence factor BrkB family protein [Vagococcus silagei]
MKTVIKTFIKTLNEAEINIYAIVITYYFILAFFPLLIALGNLLPLLHLNLNGALPYIKEILPPDIYKLVMEYLPKDFMTQFNGGLLSISAIGTFWAISKGINGIQMSLDKAYGLQKQRMQIIRRLFSFLMVFILIFVVAVLILVMGFGQTILEFVLPRVGLEEEILETFLALRWPITTSVLFVVLFMIYYLVPNVKNHFRAILPGTIFTTIGWLFMTQFFSLYVNYISKKLTSYGVIGSFILFILWLNIAATLIIIGGVINVTVQKVFFGEIEVRNRVITDYIEDKMNLSRVERNKNKNSRF